MVFSIIYTYTEIISQGKCLILLFVKGVSGSIFAEVKDLVKKYIFHLMACADASKLMTFQTPVCNLGILVLRIYCKSGQMPV